MDSEKLGITYNPSILHFSVKSFYELFTEKAPLFDDGDEHVGYSVKE